VTITTVASRRALLAGSSLGSSFTPGATPLLMDEFNTNYASMSPSGTSTVTPYGGATWSYTGQTGFNANEPFISSGSMQSNAIGNTADKRALPYLQPGAVTTTRAVTWELDAAAGFGNISTNANAITWGVHHNVITPNTAYSRLRFTWSANANGGNFSPAFITGGTLDTPSGTTSMTGTGNKSALSLFGGDTWRWVKSATEIWNLYHLGWKVFTNTADNVTGNITPTDAGFLQGSWDTAIKCTAFRNVDPATEADIWAIRPGRICQVKRWAAPGTDIYIPLRWGYSGPTPPASACLVSLIDKDGNAIGGGTYTNIQMDEFSTATAGEIRGSLTIPAASFPVASNNASARRVEIALQTSGGHFVKARTGLMWAGELLLKYGQSRVTKFWQDNYTGTYTTPPQSFSADGSVDTGGGSWPNIDENRRIQISSATTVGPNAARAHMAMCANLTTWFTHSNFTYGRCGMGGADAKERMIGGHTPTSNPAFWTSVESALALMGDVYWVYFPDHAFEVDNSSGNWATLDAAAQVVWNGIICDEVRRIEALVGHPVKVIMVPFTPFWGAGADARADTIATWIAQLVYNNGDGNFANNAIARFVLGPTVDDTQHISTADKYHLTSGPDGNGVPAWREAAILAYTAGALGTHRNGALMTGVGSLAGGNQVILEFDAMGASSVATRGDVSAATGDPRAGCHFYTDLARTIEITPTSVSVGAIASGKFNVTWTFSSVPATVYATGPTGRQPLNPTNNATIFGAMMTSAACIVLDYGDPNVGTQVFNPPQQRYFNFATGNHYVVCV